MAKRSAYDSLAFAAFVGAAALLAFSRCDAGVAFAASGVPSQDLKRLRTTGAGASPAGVTTGSSNVVAGALFAVGSLAVAAGLAVRVHRPAKTAVKYTTQTILPALSWLKTGFKVSDLGPTELIAVQLAGVDVLIGKSEGGKLFCVSNLCPHIATPMSEGADVIGDVIVCPLHGSSFNVFTGDLIDWCPSPPIIGPLTGLVIEKKKLAIFEVRSSFFGGDIEVQVDTNAKKAYEADYWKGILDAQGKNDGTYY